jgi:hypothetical protein
VEKPVNPDDLEKYRKLLYKHFGGKPEPSLIIAVALREHAFDESYALEITYPLKGGKVGHGHVAVFTAGKDTLCVGCQGRRAAGNIIHGIIPIPAEHAADLLRGHEDKSDEEQIGQLKDTFDAQIYLSDGVLYTETKPGGIRKQVAEQNKPKLTLHKAQPVGLDIGIHWRQVASDNILSDKW